MDSVKVSQEPNDSDPSRIKFRQDLDRWFQSRGIIADLRSHLRHLMVTALQNSQIDGKSKEATSPKAQAMNLLVAEYLLKRGCHYTLSVFTSEMPTMTGFGCNHFLRQKTSAKKNRGMKCKENKYSFQETEVEEIINALGLSSNVQEIKDLGTEYSRDPDKTSLLESLVQATTGLAAKSEMRQKLDEGEDVTGERFLSKSWTTSVAELLLSEKMSPSQVTSVRKSILRLTENELKRATETERRKHMAVLAERENRIQGQLRKCEKDILFKLAEAERRFRERKDGIEDELERKQRRLSEMAVEWNEKHEEIVRMSRNFYNIRNENETLRKIVEKLERENEGLQLQGRSQEDMIAELRKEIQLLVGTRQTCPQADKLDEEPVKEVPEVPTAEKEAGVDENKSSKSVRETVEKVLNVPVEEVRAANESKSLQKSEDDDRLTSESSEDVVRSARERFERLEEEFERISRNFLDYKSRRCELTECSGSDESDGCSNDSEGEKTDLTGNDRSDFLLRRSKFSQTQAERDKPIARKLDTWMEGVNGVGKVAEDVSLVAAAEPKAGLPTKRQLKHRDYFLQSRKLLRELEKETIIGGQTTGESESVADTSRDDSSPTLKRAVAKTRKEKPRAKNSVDRVDTPLKTTAFYCNPNEGRPIVDDFPPNCLELLADAKLESPGRPKPLRQQMLSDEDEEEKENEERGSRRQSVDEKSQKDSESVENVSAGRCSGGSDFW